jgi:hypothetical protein
MVSRFEEIMDTVGLVCLWIHLALLAWIPAVVAAVFQVLFIAFAGRVEPPLL